jgi:hypothetical protein
MQKRAVVRWNAVAVLLVALALASLSGCSAVTSGGFTSADARTAVAAWTHEAETTLGSPTASVRASGYETCRTDHGFFTTSWEWRTITNLSVPAASQTSAISTVSTAFTASGWVRSNPRGLVTLTGPTNERRRGLVHIETGGASTLVIWVISPCYS